MASKQTVVEERPGLDMSNPATQRSINRMLVQVYGSPEAIPESDPLKDQYVDALTKRDFRASYGIKDQIQGNLRAAESARAAAAAAAAESARRAAAQRAANNSSVAKAFGLFDDNYFNNLYRRQADEAASPLLDASRQLFKWIRTSGQYNTPIGANVQNEMGSLRDQGLRELDNSSAYIGGERQRINRERDRLGNVDAYDASVEIDQAVKQLQSSPTQMRVSNPVTQGTQQRWANTLFNGRSQ